MILFIIYSVILVLFQVECAGQNYFDLADSVVYERQTRSVEIYYDLSGGYPNPVSIPLLDSIYYFMIRNKYCRIEIGVHTDYRGDSISNIRISEIRAKRVTEYLLKRGVEIKQIKYQGYGEYYPVIVDDKLCKQYPFFAVGQNLTAEYIKNIEDTKNREIANYLNQRTEIKIISSN